MLKTIFKIHRSHWTWACLGAACYLGGNQILAMPADNGAIFRDETFIRGLYFQHIQRGESLRGLADVFGAGVCAFDFDNDGDMDLLFAGGMGQNRFYGGKSWWTQTATSRLYENDGAGYFTDITENSGIRPDYNSMGCAYGDFNQDGLTDFVISSTTEDLLYQNTGRGHFSEKPLGSGKQWTTGITPIDVNQDGLLDLYITGYLDFDHSAKHLESNSGFAGPNSPQFNPGNYTGISNYLFINSGNGEFIDKASELAVTDTDGRSIQSVPLYLDKDNKPDLLVINDRGSKPKVLLNRYPQPFISGDNIIEPPLNTLSLRVQHLSKDESPSLLFGSASGKIKSVYKNTPLREQGKDRMQSLWTDMAWSTIISPERLLGFSTPGILARDFNGDGETDIYLGNGLFSPDADSPEVSIAQADILLLQNKDVFIPAPTPGIARTSTRGLINIDIDNDGDQDVLSSNNNDFPLLLINGSDTARWIGLALTDKWGNAGHFRRVKIITNQKTRYYAPETPGFLSQGDHRITLALQENEIVQEIQVIWHSGNVSRIRNISSNQYNAIKEGSTFSVQRSMLETQAAPQPLFKTKWHWLLEQYNLSQLSTSFDSWSKQEKTGFITFIEQQPLRQQSLAVIQKALADKNQDVVMAAVGSIQSLEPETSYRLLSPLLNEHNHTEILCKTAEAIEHFFFKEEAVITRKNLFASDMLAILNDVDDPAKICFISALAQSKSYRATQPLEQLLQSGNPLVQQAAAYALGELKYRRSLTAMQQLVTQKKSSKSSGDMAIAKITGSNLKDIAHTSAVVNVKSGRKITEPGPLCKGLTTNNTILVNLCTPAIIQSALIQQPLSAEEITALLENSAIGGEKYAIILKYYAESFGAAANDYLIKLLKRDSASNSHIAQLIQTLDDTDTKNSAMETIKGLYLDNNQRKTVRIKAGDYLITRDKGFMKKHMEIL